MAKGSKQNRKVAIFDIDGTIFRSSLLIEVTDALIQEGLFPAKASQVYAKAYRDWLNRRGTYGQYIGDVVKAFEKYILKVNYYDYLKVTRKVVEFHKNRVYRYTRDLVTQLKEKNYYLMAISHSPRDLVQGFCEDMGFDKIYGRIHEVDAHDRFTGVTLYADLIANKAKILERAVIKENLSLKSSVGVGDTDSDIPFLSMVDTPICFNPNSKLYKHAKSKRWRIVVERKDVIYEV